MRGGAICGDADGGEEQLWAVGQELSVCACRAEKHRLCVQWVAAAVIQLPVFKFGSFMALERDSLRTGSVSPSELSEDLSCAEHYRWHWGKDKWGPCTLETLFLKLRK